MKHGPIPLTRDEITLESLGYYGKEKKEQIIRRENKPWFIQA